MIIKSKKTILASVAAACLSCNGYAAEINTNSALMQALDKVTGRVSKITVPVNSKIAFGDFSLVLRSCKKRPAEEAPENFAFIDVADKSFGTEEYSIFRGWVLSSAPGISAIEHPIYDVWLLECVDSEVDKSKLLTEEELAQRDSLPEKNDISGEDKIETSRDAGENGDKEEKVIHIQEFIQQDRDIEKDIRQIPAYISEPSASYVSDIEEGNEPQNLLQFTKMQEINVQDKKEHVSSSVENSSDVSAETSDDDLTQAIDAEIETLNQPVLKE